MVLLKGFIFMVNANGHSKSNISHKRNHHLLTVPMPPKGAYHGTTMEGLFGTIRAY